MRATSLSNVRAPFLLSLSVDTNFFPNNDPSVLSEGKRVLPYAEGEFSGLFFVGRDGHMSKVFESDAYISKMRECSARIKLEESLGAISKLKDKRFSFGGNVGLLSFIGYIFSGLGHRVGFVEPQLEIMMHYNHALQGMHDPLYIQSGSVSLPRIVDEQRGETKSIYSFASAARALRAS